MTWNDLLERYVTGMVHRNYRAATLKAYRYWMERLSLFAQGLGLGPTDVTPDTVQAYREHMNQLPYSPWSVAQATAVARQFFRWGVKEGLLFEDPMKDVVIPRTTGFYRNCPTVEDVHRLLTMPNPLTTMGLRDRTALELLYGVGLRIGECVRLDVDDVDLDQAILSVRHSKTTPRVLPLGPHLVLQLNAWLRVGRPKMHRKPKETALFLSKAGNRLERPGFQVMVKGYSRKAGLKGVTAYHLRHAFGSHLLTAGADIKAVQLLLGHRHLNTTQGYTHLTDENLVDLMRRAHPRHAPPNGA
jgi:integrase/recombinase XerD